MSRKRISQDEAEYRKAILELSIKQDELLEGSDLDDVEDNDEVMLAIATATSITRTELSVLVSLIDHPCLICDGYLELEFKPGAQIFLFLVCDKCNTRHMLVQGKLRIFTQ